jgi:hypothetical protein
MASSRRLVVSRHLRDPATASNTFFFVSINQFQRINDTQGGIALQEVYHIKALFPFHVDQMAEVSTNQIINSGDGANRHMAGVIAVFRGEDGLFHVSGGELFHLLRNLKDIPRVKGSGKEFTDPLRRFGQFVHRYNRREKSETALLHLPPKLLRSRLKLVVEVAAQHGSIKV